jgi:hypothetical protein
MSIKCWDSVDVVKAFYGVAHNPIEEPSPLAGNAPESRAFYRSSYYYWFPDLGVSIFFGADLRVTGVRFDRPFTGKIGGVAIGTARIDLERLKGKLARTFMPVGIGFPDPEFLALQRTRKEAIIDALPDPVSKQDVLETLRALAAIDNEPLQYTTPLICHVGTDDYVRYDLGHSGTVQSNSAQSCVVE